MRTSSLFFRTAITLALAFVIFQSVALWVVYRSVIVPIAERSADDLAGLIVLSAQTWVELPPQTRPAFERELSRQHGLSLVAETAENPPAAKGTAATFSFRSEIESALSTRLGETIALVGIADNSDVWVELAIGEHDLRVGFEPQRYAVELPFAALAIIGFGALASLLTALFLVQRLTVPLARAAAAAGQVGAGETPEPLPETGPSELVELARRFNRMAREVRELLDNRTTLLAGISHDLRTPMTRLRLGLELQLVKPDPQRIDRAIADVMAMDALISGYMELARSTRAEERTPIELAALLSELAEESGVECECTAECTLLAAPTALRQIIRNLIENALRYGADAPVLLRLDQRGDTARITVRDQGPGIPAEQLEKVFRPFYRLESSRSTATGGSGLGLAIVRQLAETQGWQVTLCNRSEGGMDAVVELPIRSED